MGLPPVLLLSEVESLLSQSDDLLDVHQAAAYLRVTAEDIEAWADERLLPGQRVANVWVFRQNDLRNWLISGQLRLQSRPTPIA